MTVKTLLHILKDKNLQKGNFNSFINLSPQMTIH